MNNLDLTRWLLKVRNALAEQNEAERNSMLRAANEFLRRNNQSLALRGRDPRNLEGARALSSLSSRDRVVGPWSKGITGAAENPLREEQDS